ncbi:MAG: molybdopterin dinucleotide binding domain-containing protein, partial [Raoultibacter sp.]
WAEYVEDYQENGWINAKEIEPDKWGTYRRFETGWMRMGKDACTAKLFNCDAVTGQPVDNFGFPTPTALTEFWPILFETYAIDKANEYEPGRYDLIHEILPHYDEPASGPRGTVDMNEYPIVLTTGRRIPVYFHSEHRQLPWCRELWPVPRLEMNPEDAKNLGLEQGEWAWIETEWGKVRQCVDLYHGI